MIVCTPVEIYIATAQRLSRLLCATRSPCLLQHGRLVFTQSEGKHITVLRQPLPCFSHEHRIEILRHWSPCLFQIQLGNPSQSGATFLHPQS